jgi:peptidoglycan/LPS O-acetylase OafA/YrhL
VNNSIKRNVGLDIVRSTAIILVLINHFFYLTTSNYYSLILTKNFWFLTPFFGYYGVDLFFVLSGFLIGRILIKSFILENRGDFLELINFYTRRWIRTLPLYYLILILCIFIYSLQFFPIPEVFKVHSFPWHHFFFLQGIFNNLNFMPISWSLAVEEWFYLIFPLYILFAKYFFKNFSHKIFLISLIIFTIFPVFLRLFIFLTNESSFSWLILRGTFTRIDSIAIGVLFAYLFIFKEKLFNKLSSIPAILVSLFILIFPVVIYSLMSTNIIKYITDQNATAICATIINFSLSPWIKNIYVNTIMFTLISLSFGVIISRFYKLEIKPIKFFTNISKYSYSMYLVHVPIYQFASFYILNFSKVHNENIILCLFIVILSLIFVLLFTYYISKILYIFFEKPIMDLRDSFKSTEITKLTD